MHKYITLLFSLLLLTSYGQISLEKIISWNNYDFKKIQKEILSQGHTLIENNKLYRYTPQLPCSSYYERIDTCRWGCTNPKALESVESKYPLNNVKFENEDYEYYEIRETLDCTFGLDYNREEKSARTFIDIEQWKTRSNTNCKKDFYYSQNSICFIKIQFNDLYDWKNFKSDLVNKGYFIDTFQYDEDSPLKINYGVCVGPLSDKISEVFRSAYKCSGLSVQYTEYEKYTIVNITLNNSLEY